MQSQTEEMPIFLWVMGVLEILLLSYLCGIGTTIEQSVCLHLKFISVDRARSTWFLITINNNKMRVFFFFLSQSARFYNELLMTKHYLLPSNQQKIYMLIVKDAQRGVQLNVANLAPLNANTYIVVSYLFIRP